MYLPWWALIIGAIVVFLIGLAIGEDEHDTKIQELQARIEELEQELEDKDHQFSDYGEGLGY